MVMQWHFANFMIIRAPRHLHNIYINVFIWMKLMVRYECNISGSEMKPLSHTSLLDKTKLAKLIIIFFNCLHLIVMLGFELKLLFSVIIVEGGSAGDGITVRYLEICVFLWCRVKGNSKMRAHAVEKNAFETNNCLSCFGTPAGTGTSVNWRCRTGMSNKILFSYPKPHSKSLPLIHVYYFVV